MKIISILQTIFLAAIAGLAGFSIFVANSDKAQLIRQVKAQYYTAANSKQAAGAYSGLVLLGQADAVKKEILTTLKSSEKSKKMAALRLAGALGSDTATIDEIKKNAGSTDLEIASLAIQTLGSIPDPKIDAVLLESCKSTNNDILLVALKTIKKRKATSIAEALSKIEFKDDVVSKQAETTLEALGFKKKKTYNYDDY